jgi:hypothetical protein
MDESRTIASEYVGGREMYPVEDMEANAPMGNNGFGMRPPTSSRQHIPPMQGIAQESYQQAQLSYNFEQPAQQHHGRSSKSRFRGENSS